MQEPEAWAVTIRPSMLPDFSLPTPYRVHADGRVADQRIWRGERAVLLGFQRQLDVQEVELWYRDWLASQDLDAVVGMYPVFIDTEGHCIVHDLIAVASVERAVYEER